MLEGPSFHPVPSSPNPAAGRACLEHHRPVAAQEVDLQIYGLPIAALSTTAIDLAFDLGRAKAEHSSTVSSQFENVRTYLQGLAARFAHQPFQRWQLAQELRDAYHDGMLSLLEERARSAGFRSGLASGRLEDLAIKSAAREELNQLLNLDLCSSLRTRVPGLERATEVVYHEEERRGLEVVHSAEKLAIRVSIALRRFWPDFREVFSILEGSSPTELSCINRSFKERYGRDIQEDIAATCRRPGLGYFYRRPLIEARSSALFNGEHIQAAAIGLVHLMSPLVGRPSGKAVAATLRGIAPAERPVFAAAFNRHRSSRCSSFDRLAEHFTSSSAEKIAALLQGDTLTADTIELDKLLKARHRSARHDVITLMERYQGDTLRELSVRYERRYGVALADAVHRAFPEAELRDRFEAWVGGDRERHVSACLRSALLHSSPTPLTEYFLGVDRHQRTAMVRNYTRHYGTSLYRDMREHLTRRCWGLLRSYRDYYLAVSAIRHGRLCDEELIYQCVDGVGTDVQGIKRVLRHKREEEIVELTQRFANLTRRRLGRAHDLFRRLQLETSGDDWLDVRQLLRGWPSTPERWIQRVQESHRHERSGLFNRIDLITREGPIMDRDVERARSYFQSQSARGSLSNLTASRVETLARFALRDCSAFRRAKNALADTLANVGGAGASIATILATSIAGIPLHGNLLLIAATIAAVSTLTRLTIKKLFKGAGYSGEEAVKDLLFGGVDGAAPVLAKFSPISMIRRGLNVGAKLGGRAAVTRVSQSFFERRTAAHTLRVKNLESFLELSDSPLERPHALDSMSLRGGAGHEPIRCIDIHFESLLSALEGGGELPKL